MRRPGGRRCRIGVAALALMVVVLLGPAPATAAVFAEGAPATPASAPRVSAMAPAAPLAAPQEPGEEHAATEHEADPRAWWYWPSKWFNFIALAALLYWMLVIPPQAVQDIFSFPGLRVVFVERAREILAARDLAAQQQQEAARLLADSEQRLSKIADEVAALVADARSDAEAEQSRALRDGRAQAEKIHEVAERELRHQRVAAQRQLRRFVADLAVSLAETNLAQHLTADDQDRLIREYLARLGPSLA